MAIEFSIEPVVKVVTVPCTPEEAFRYFTNDFGMWWPAATNSVVAYASDFKDQPELVTFDAHLGGRIYERTRANEEHLWGTVLVWQPPTRVAFSFHPGRDESAGQTVEVTFSPVPDGTRVVLMHTGWEQLAAEAQATRNRYDQGWNGVFVAAFSEFIQSRT